jgi:hypothetical protein
MYKQCNKKEYSRLPASGCGTKGDNSDKYINLGLKGITGLWKRQSNKGSFSIWVCDFRKICIGKQKQKKIFCPLWIHHHTMYNN